MGAQPFQPDEFLKWMERALDGKSVTCRRAAFERDGHLSFTMETPSGDATVLMGPKTGAGVQGPDWTLTPAPGSEDGTAWEAASRFVLGRLNALINKYHVPVIDLLVPNRPERPVSFGRGLFRERLGNFLVPGRTRCGEHVFAGDGYDESCLRFEFESARSRLVLEMRPEPDLPGALFSTRSFSVLAGLDERSADQVADAAVERYLGFLMALCDTPGVEYEITSGKRAVVADSTIEYGKELAVQFFVDETGHESFDCHHVFTGCPGPVVGLYHSERDCGNYGFYEPVVNIHAFPTFFRHRPRPEDGERLWITDLGEADVVMGAEENLREDIAQAALKPGVKMVIVGGTCHTRVMGEDVGRVVREEAGEHGDVIVAHHDMARLDPADRFQSNRGVWSNLLEARLDRSLEPRPDTVNLVGYGATGSRQVCELRDLLAELDIRVGTCLLPEMDFDEIKGFGTAALNVVSPWHDVYETFRSIDSWCGIPSVRPPLPLGRRACRDWLKGAAEKVHGRVIPDGDVPDLPEAALERWNKACSRAADLCAGFVIMSTQTHSVLDVARSHGFLFPGFLAEMGFALKVLYWDPPGVHHHHQRVAPGEFETRMRELAGDGDLEVTTFEDPGELVTLLGRSGMDLCCSEIRFDPRLQTAGISQFHVEDLDMGLAGSVPVVERLVRRATNGFRRRYHGLFSKQD